MSKELAAAQAAEKAGQWAAAERLYKAAARANPKNPKFLVHQIEFALRAPSGLPGAFLPLKNLFKLAPNSSVTLTLAARAYSDSGELLKSLEFAEKAAKCDQQNHEAHFVHATILEKLGEMEKALLEVNKVLELRPGHPNCRYLKAGILVSLGRLGEAAEIYRSLHKDYPDRVLTYVQYAQTGKYSLDDPIVRDLLDRVLPAARKSEPKVLENVLRAVARFHQDQGNHEEAFLAYQELKAVEKTKPNYVSYKKSIDAQINGINRADFFGWQGSSDERPVFIVGMPRSGSTLLEQILSGHSEIGGIGESTLMKNLALKNGIDRSNGPQMVDKIRNMTPENAVASAEYYLKAARDLEPGKARIVDKFLHNFEQLALISRFFPKARILHATRDPMDNCVSCYMSNLSVWHSYTRTLTSMGQFYREHVRLMNHWKKALPNPILEVRYEDVVADTEGKAREIIAFLGLEWDPNCLKFQENNNSARTLSAWQVRQPIYKTSVKRWKRYEKYLDPLKAELKEFYPDGFE